MLLPLPLSPTSATISRSWMARSKSSTACSIRFENMPPRRKCRVRSWFAAAPRRRRATLLPAWPAMFTCSARVVGLLRVQQAAHLGRRRPCTARVRWSGTAPSPRGSGDESGIRWAAARGRAGCRGCRLSAAAGPADRGKRIQQAAAVRVQRPLEDRVGRQPTSATCPAYMTITRSE